MKKTAEIAFSLKRKLVSVQHETRRLKITKKYALCEKRENLNAEMQRRDMALREQEMALQKAEMTPIESKRLSTSKHNAVQKVHRLLNQFPAPDSKGGIRKMHCSPSQFLDPDSKDNVQKIHRLPSQFPDPDSEDDDADIDFLRKSREKSGHDMDGNDKKTANY